MESKLTFEDNIRKLEDIVKQLERGDKPLDDMIKLFEQGVAISKECKKTLDEAQQKVSVLLTDSEQPQTRPLDV